MTKIEALLEQLPDAQRAQVENYAASLLGHRYRVTATDNLSDKPNRIRLEELDGLLVRMAGNVSDDEIAKRVLNAWADAAED